MLRLATRAAHCFEVIVQFFDHLPGFFVASTPWNSDARFALIFWKILVFCGHGRRKILAFARRGGNPPVVVGHKLPVTILFAATWRRDRDSPKGKTPRDGKRPVIA